MPHVATSPADLLETIRPAAHLDGERLVIDDEAAFRSTAIRDLAWTAAFSDDDATTTAAQWLVWEASQELGASSASIQELYAARGRGIRVVHATYEGTSGGRPTGTARLWRALGPAIAEWEPGATATKVIDELLAPGDLEQFPVGALGLGVDVAPDEREEVALPPLEPGAHDRPRLGNGQRPAERGREPRQEARGRDRLAERLGSGSHPHQVVRGTAASDACPPRAPAIGRCAGPRSVILDAAGMPARVSPAATSSGTVGGRSRLSSC